MFSVLLSVYAKEHPAFLEKSLDSIFAQSLLPTEVILVEDGPLTPELDAVVANFQRQYAILKVIVLAQNQGLGKALNEGLKHCSYELVARMDTDDIAVANRLEEQAKILEKNPTIDMLGGFIEEYDQNMEKKIGIRKVPIGYEPIKKYIKWQCPFNHVSVIMKKSTLIKIGNYQDVPLEDYELWGRMLINHCHIENCNKVLVKCRTGKEMYKRRSGKKRIQEVIQLEKKLLSYKIISKGQFIINIIIRSIFALLPIRLKSVIYPIIRK